MSDRNDDRGPADARPVLTERLELAPLKASDAEEMFSVLDDAQLYVYIGGEPSTLDGLRIRYVKLEAGSGKRSEVWVNWIVRLRTDGGAIGTVQATIAEEHEPKAEVAWVIGVPWQGQGYASEAAGALVAWLRGRGIRQICAHVHPDHRASQAVARRIGMHPTDVQHDGETLWEMR